uniref:DNA polymerase III subunit gamma and tau n=1 Tax=Granulicoccus phenolivorans TaxID=266854 RepID=UPI0004057C91|nr:DNA polymerase III subunit gamma and tau [Granulicoccus phenolivorans]
MDPEEDDDQLDEYGFEPSFEQDGPSLLGDEPDEPEDAPDPAAESDPEPAPAPPTDSVATPPAAATHRTEPPREAPLALYRRYRPDTFEEVIGQEHVTKPLQRALANNRVNHAYLFSGPRGCGKTTSARILARCLNCEQGPTPTPCGECESCRELATGGPGSLDVIEIDAASHGGVDDARDLREKAFFAPVKARFKVYIVDEAHMVTPAGFNALLKVVEEPPPHVKFIFATTEPEKVIGTIRSRTHHYPFRLVPPKVLGGYLGEICRSEGIAIEQSVLPLVVRAGAGSVRDSLSVLDQLLGGAAEQGVSYDQATGLLGFTPDSLLDAMLDAFAAGDASSVFSTIDRVIEIGQDPKRFAEDLLQRLRDLVIFAAVPDAIAAGLIDAAEDQTERYRAQTAQLGVGELTRAAEVLATGLTEMRGTTAPRLHLELMCARVLLPGADAGDRGVHARLDRLERRVGMDGAPGAAEPALTAPISAPPPAVTPAAPAPAAQVPFAAPVPPSAAVPSPAPAAPEPARRPAPAPRPAATAPEPVARPTAPAHPVREPEPAPAAPAAGPGPAAAAEQPAGAGPTLADVRRLWPDVLETLKGMRRFAWILISQNAQVGGVHDGVLTLMLRNDGARDRFHRGGNETVLREALIQVMGVDLRIEAVVEGTTAPQGGSGRGPQARQSGPAPRQPAPAPTPDAPAPMDRQPEQSRPAPPQPAPQQPAPQQPAPQQPAPQQGGPAAAPPAPPQRVPAQSQREPGHRTGPEPTDPPVRGTRTGPANRRPAAPHQVEPPPYDEEPPPPEDEPPFVDPGPPTRPAAPHRDSAGARSAIRPMAAARPRTPTPDPEPEVEPDRNDTTVEGDNESTAELLARHLGAELIEEDVV